MYFLVIFSQSIKTLWMNFIGELSVLLSGTIIRPTKINDMNTDGKKKQGEKKEHEYIYKKKKNWEKRKKEKKNIYKKGEREKKNLSLAIYTDNLK